MVVVPFKAFPAFTEEIVLDGQTYTFKFFWNVRGGYWSMTIFDSDSAVIVAGLKVVNRYMLTPWYPDRGLPPGILAAIDTTKQDSRLAYEDMTNARCSLVYMTEAEVEAL